MGAGKFRGRKSSGGTDDNYRPTGQLEGDTGAMSDKGASTKPGYDYGKSLDGASKSDLHRGYTNDGRG